MFKKNKLLVKYTQIVTGSYPLFIIILLTGFSFILFLAYSIQIPQYKTYRIDNLDLSKSYKGEAFLYNDKNIDVFPVKNILIEENKITKPDLSKKYLYIDIPIKSRSLLKYLVEKKRVNND